VLKRHLHERYVYANRRKVTPLTLLTALFKRLREQAGAEVTAFRGTPPGKAVLTVPALYGPMAEKLLREAAQAAGFAEVELLPEPVAAARAWLLETGETEQEVVVLDCGGGTLDLAYLRCQQGEMRLVPECPHSGDVHIGGHDVDLELLRLVREKAEEMEEDIEARQPFYLQQVRVLKEGYCRGLAMRPLRIQGREIRLEPAEIDMVFEDRFIEQACESLKSYLGRVAALNNNKLPAVLLVGGSARLKGLRELVESRCGCKAVGWERAEFATALGAVSTPAPQPGPRPVIRTEELLVIDPTPPSVVMPPVQDIHGWPAEKVQALQQQAAQVLGLPVEFRDTLKDGSEGPVMVVIPPGRFLMGSPEDELGRYDNEYQHSVEVAPFAIGKYAVTFEEYDRFASATGRREKPSDAGWGRGRQPVINVTWLDAVAYAEWLSKQTDQQYRLPTEAEWEYACRAGTKTAYHFGAAINADLANYNSGGGFFKSLVGAFSGRTVEVGRYPANAWGLHDMHGNVWEWTCSVYDKDYGGGEQRCAEPDTGGPCVLRGGSWTNVPLRVRGAARLVLYPPNVLNLGGFRLARTFSL